MDNSLISTGEEIDFYSLMDDVEADEEEDILTQKELEKAAKDTSYENVSGRLQVSFPRTLGNGEGICMTLDGYEIELTPETSGTSVGWAEDNAVRYTDVYENIDYQYTVLGAVSYTHLAGCQRKKISGIAFRTYCKIYDCKCCKRKIGQFMYCVS